MLHLTVVDEERAALSVQVMPNPGSIPTRGRKLRVRRIQNWKGRIGAVVASSWLQARSLPSVPAPPTPRDLHRLPHRPRESPNCTHRVGSGAGPPDTYGLRHRLARCRRPSSCSGRFHKRLSLPLPQPPPPASPLS